MLSEDTGHHLVDGGNDVKELVVGHVLERKLALRHVARVRLAKHGVTVAGNDTSRVEGLPPSKKSSFIIKH